MAQEIEGACQQTASPWENKEAESARAIVAETMLQAKGIRRRSAARILLDDISIEIDAGDQLAIVGPTGSGKTLLLRSLALLDPLDAGEICWRGQLVRGNDLPKFRSRVIYLHQRPALLEGTVEDNLRQPLSLRLHKDKRFSRARIVQLLESLGRDASFLAKQQRDLSGGESQLTALLRAIQLDPNVLLLDEPTAALDAAATEVVAIIPSTTARRTSPKSRPARSVPELGQHSGCRDSFVISFPFCV